MAKRELIIFCLLSVPAFCSVSAAGSDCRITSLIRMFPNTEYFGGSGAFNGKEKSPLVPAAFPENRWSPGTVRSRGAGANVFRQEEIDPEHLPSKIIDAVAQILDLSNEGRGNEHGFFVAVLDNGEVRVSAFVTSHENDGISEQASDAILNKFLPEQEGKLLRLQFFHTHPAWGIPSTWSLSPMDVSEALRWQAMVGVPVDMHLVPPELNRQSEVPLRVPPPIGPPPKFDANGRTVPNSPAPAPPPRIIKVSPAIMRISVP